MGHEPHGIFFDRFVGLASGLSKHLPSIKLDEWWGSSSTTFSVLTPELIYIHDPVFGRSCFAAETAQAGSYFTWHPVPSIWG